MSRRNAAAPTARASRGFSLVELMVGVGISLVVLMAAAAMYISTADIGRTNQRVSEIEVSGQQAIDALRRDIINAGFRGLTADPDQIVAAGIAVTNDCGVGFATNLRQGVWAANDSNPFSATCVPSANYLGGDVLAIRRLAVAPTGALQSGRLYLRSAFQTAEFFVGTTPPAHLAFTPRFDYRADAVVYFVSPFTASAAEDPPVPALYRVRLLPGPAIGTPELVAPGVEDLQVQFDVLDRSTAQLQVVDPGAAPLDADSVNRNGSGWDNVTAVRLFLLVRARSGEARFEPGERTYTLGSRQVTFDDNIPRQVVSSVFSLRNR